MQKHCFKNCFTLNWSEDVFVVIRVEILGHGPM